MMSYILITRDEETFLKALLDLVKEEIASGNRTETYYSGNPIDGYIGFINSRKPESK